MAATTTSGNGSRTAAQETLDQRIAELVEVVRSNQERLASLEARITEAKEELYQLLKQRGSNWADDDGYARLNTDGLRRFYDTSALDELIITDPLRYGWLKDYRREAVVRGGVRVK